jgi:hypothetical protein
VRLDLHFRVRASALGGTIKEEWSSALPPSGQCEHHVVLKKTEKTTQHRRSTQGHKAKKGRKAKMKTTHLLL